MLLQNGEMVYILTLN